MPEMTMQQVLHCLDNPGWTLRELDRVDAECSLRRFIQLMWSILEPGRDFTTGWAVDAICEHLEAITSGQIRRLLINVPPGCTKSMTTNVMWPAWEWGPKNRPALRYMCASYSDKLTIRDNRRCRNVIKSELYQMMWGNRFRLSGEQNAKVRFDNDHMGFKIATSVGGLGTGERADRVVIDDPNDLKHSESDAKRESVNQWFTEVMPTRYNDPDKSASVIIMQRVHERDVSGIALAHDLGYEHLCLPMRYEKDHPHKTITKLGFEDPRREDGEILWPERFSQSHVDELEKTLSAWGGTYAVAGQLQQRPAPRGGGMFQKKDFQYVEVAPEKGMRVRGWDLAGSVGHNAAYTAGVKMLLTVDRKVYIEHVVRERVTAHGMEQLMLATARADGLYVTIDFPQDPGQAGKHQKSALGSLLTGFKFFSTPETGSKEDRAQPLSAQAEAGNVYLVRAPWNDPFVAEACVFPNGRYKDQIDAASRAYARLLVLIGAFRMLAGPELIRGRPTDSVDD